jgi:hypothetical protein
MKPTKVQFCTSQVKFLGHIVTEEGILPDHEKVRPIQDMPLPQDRNEVRVLLGTFGYYRKWIKGYASIVDPLNALLKANVGIPRDESGRVAFTQDQLDAIAEVKKALI